MRATAGPIALSLILTLSTLAIAGPLEGDAGSGMDAGDTEEDAFALDEEGTYNGSLVPPGDADWYRLSFAEALGTRQAPLCVQTTISGDAHADVTLAMSSNRSRDVTRLTQPFHRLELGLAAGPVPEVLVGLEPGPLQPAGDATSSYGNYTMALEALRVDDVNGDDGNTLEVEPTDDDGVIIDAGDQADTALPVPASCFSGWLRNGSDVDRYSFEAKAGDPLALAFVDTPFASVNLSLISPAGDLIATVADGGFDIITLEQAGTWQLELDRVGDGHDSESEAHPPGLVDLMAEEGNLTADGYEGPLPYVVGFSLNGPEPEPCRPTCLGLV